MAAASDEAQKANDAPVKDAKPGEKTFPESYVKELRAEAAENRVKVKELSEKYDTLATSYTETQSALKLAAGIKETDNKTDPISTLTKKLEELSGDFQKERDERAKSFVREKENAIEAALRVASHTAGAIAPEDVARLVDRSEVQYDPESREVTGVEELVADLKKARPHYFGEEREPTPFAGTPGGGTPRSPKQNREPESLQDKILKQMNQRYGTPTGSGFNPALPPNPPREGRGY